MRRVRKLLICPYCGDVIGDVVLHPLAGWLGITAPDGRELIPEQGAIHRRRAEQEIAAATSATDRDAAQARLEFVGRHIGELTYELPCLRGHRVLATAPQITRAVRRAKGTWARL
jgi:hypothetical protein